MLEKKYLREKKLQKKMMNLRKRSMKNLKLGSIYVINKITICQKDSIFKCQNKLIAYFFTTFLTLSNLIWRQKFVKLAKNWPLSNLKHVKQKIIWLKLAFKKTQFSKQVVKYSAKNWWKMETVLSSLSNFLQ